MPATVLGTQSVTIGVGTTAQRPAAVQGMIRLNTTIGQVEIYDGTQWTPLVAPSYNTLSLDTNGNLIHEQIVSGSGNATIDAENALSAFFSNSVSLSIDTSGNLSATY
jgi:hypothetical protein